MKALRYAIVVSLILISCSKKTDTLKKQKFDYKAEWESLKQHQTPDWFLDAKFGIYCHWGPYSVPAYETEWYSHWMYVDGNNPEARNGKAHKIHKHHVAKYGTLDTFGYKDFIPMFTAEKFDPAEWAQLFKDAGAKFAGPVSEHADGFAMWDSELTKWDAKEMGPKRDIMGELSKEIRKRDMKFIATFHRQWLYAWFPTWDENTDASNPEYAGLYGPKVNRGDFVYPNNPHRNRKFDPATYPMAGEEFNQQWLDRLKEIVDKYSPDMVWFDNKVDVIAEQYRKDFLQYYYQTAQEKNQEVVSTYKFFDFAKGSAVLDLERSRMKEKKEFPWLTDDSIDWKAWSHISNPQYKSTNRLIDFLVDVVSKNGAVLLNITPRADGSIPNGVKERLLEMGDWLEINGEAIYGTRPFEIYGEGDFEVKEGHLSEHKNSDNTSKDIRFTTKGDVLYATVLDWPEEGRLKIKSLAKGNPYLIKEISNIEFLANNSKVGYVQNESCLEIQLPKEKIGNHAFVFKIEF